MEIDLASVLDLTEGAVRRSLGVSEKRLLECDWRAEGRPARRHLRKMSALESAWRGLKGWWFGPPWTPAGRT